MYDYVMYLIKNIIQYLNGFRFISMNIIQLLLFYLQASVYKPFITQLIYAKIYYENFKY